MFSNMSGEENESPQEQPNDPASSSQPAPIPPLVLPVVAQPPPPSEETTPPPVARREPQPMTKVTPATATGCINPVTDDNGPLTAKAYVNDIRDLILQELQDLKAGQRKEMSSLCRDMTSALGQMTPPTPKNEQTDSLQDDHALMPQNSTPTACSPPRGGDTYNGEGPHACYFTS